MKSNSFVVLAIFYRNSLHSIRPHCPLTFKEAIQQSATQMCELHIFFSLPTSQFNFTSSTSFNSIVHVSLLDLVFVWSQFSLEFNEILYSSVERERIPCNSCIFRVRSLCFFYAMAKQIPWEWPHPTLHLACWIIPSLKFCHLLRVLSGCWDPLQEPTYIFSHNYTFTSKNESNCFIRNYSKI